MKSFYKLATIIVISLLLIAVLTGCSEEIRNPETLDENYVEATGVRVPSAVVYLSPDGATSSYQLETTIIPENATNRKLIYYVSPDDIQYFTVDENGLIKSKKTTEQGKSVPIKIYSSTNTKAFTIVSVVIEYVEVKEVFFPTDSMQVLYNSQPIQLSLNFKPYHAQDGRDVIYSSQNNEVATVDNAGLLTIKDVGITRIFATGNTLSGRRVEGNIQIVVAYASGKGKYRLDVTNQPKYDQVIGDFDEISFHIITLDPHVDPNPDIKWRVAGKRILSQDGEREFKYKPEDDSTPASYYITAEITPKGEMLIILESALISLFKPFTGFTLKKTEPSGMKYGFGEQIVFEPLMLEVDTCDWFLKKQGETGLGSFMGNTINDHTNAAFVLNADFHGAYVLTVQGKIGNVAMITKEFEFNIIKYMIGDRVQIVPETNLEEKVPDSFDWYLHNYDNTSQAENIKDRINSSGLFLGTTNGGEAFNYEATGEGWYVISSIPTIRGVHFTVTTDGETTKMVKYSSPFRVWEKAGVSTITYLSVDGSRQGNEYWPVIKWNQLAGVNGFVIEVVAGSKIHIIDTTEKNNDERNIIYRDYSVILPPSLITLEDSFSVRVRQKGGVFCEKVVYAAESIAKTHYAYLEEINFSINRYIKDMYEIGELLNYITTYKPQNLLASSSDGISTYKVRIASKLAYRNVDRNAYPVNVESDYESENLTNIHNLVYGAVNAYEIKNILNLSFTHNDIDMSYEITFSVVDSEEFANQAGQGAINYGFETNFASITREAAFNDFAINPKDTISVETSTQLYYAVMMGKRPVPVVGSIAEDIYDEAKIILNSIISHNMTTYEKVLAIYDFLASEVENDKVLKQYSRMENEPKDLYIYAGYHLEGAILYRKAISQGISKAFVLLCWMEGITAQSVNGRYMQAPHSWNKVLIGENWYNIDCAQARVQRENGAAITYAYFLVSDARMATIGFRQYGKPAVSSDNYESSNIINGVIKISSGEQLEISLLYYSGRIGEKPYSFGIEFNPSFETDMSFRNYLAESIQTTLEGSLITVKELLQITETYFILVLELPLN